MNETLPPSNGLLTARSHLRILLLAERLSSAAYLHGMVSEQLGSARNPTRDDHERFIGTSAARTAAADALREYVDALLAPHPYTGLQEPPGVHDDGPTYAGVPPFREDDPGPEKGGS